MLDRYVVPRLQPGLRAVAQRLHRQGLAPDQVTVLGFAAGLLAVVLIALEHTGWAAVFIALNRLADGLDGELARLDEYRDGAQAAGGAYLDITLDFVFYAMVPLGFAIAEPTANALPAAMLLASYMGTGASFLAFAALAQQRDIEHPHFAYKGLYYLDGLAEGTETIIFMLIACIWPQSFALLALGFAAICTMTAVNRLVGGYLALRRSACTKSRNAPY